jgi:endonuclease YncB( thermonuclease family)
LRPILANHLWHRRSRKGKVAGAVLAGFAAIVGISFAVPTEQEVPEPTAADQLTTGPGKDATAEETTTEETATIFTLDEPGPRLVARVIDGDTLDLVDGMRIRLVQIDAPERSGECYGRKAGTILRELLPAGTRVRLQADPALDRRDRFGRLLRYVFKGRTNVNLALIQRGAASVWLYNGDEGRYADRLLRAAESAQRHERGVWGACAATLNPYRAFTAQQKASAPSPLVPTNAPDCHESYEGACLDPNSSDYDCEGGEGDGPDYTGLVRVVGPDEFELDRDRDGFGCEDS